MKEKFFRILCALFVVPVVFASSVSAATYSLKRDSARSDTVGNFMVTRGNAYTFKITSSHRPLLTAGSKSFRHVSTRQSGNHYFIKFSAVGKAGDGCGFYLDDGKRPVAVARIAVKTSKAFTTIQTNAFTLKVPGDWDTSTRPEVVFGKEHYEFGSVTEVSYDAAQPISRFYGNHAEEISKKEIKTFSLPATEVVLRRSSPAAAGKQSSADELHYYLISRDRGVAYDLNFNLTFVDHDTAEKIAQTFKTK